MTRRLALSDQRLNFGLRLTTLQGARVSASPNAVQAAFRFIGTSASWYVSDDLQTPFVQEAQWRLERLGCLSAGSFRSGALDLPTIRAVQAYQRANHLPVLGTIGPRTRFALDRDLLAGLPRTCG
ncbi:MAG: peptidoglycan-binding protein [Thermoleophilia bacterium]|nr:peptidoglycan-binding protein [Thermoleophilia bacterium]